MKQRILVFLIALDCLALVVLTLGNCRRGETISASAWRQEQAGRLQGRLARPAIDWLFTWVERDHCKKAWIAEIHQCNLPPEGRA